MKQEVMSLVYEMVEEFQASDSLDALEFNASKYREVIIELIEKEKLKAQRELLAEILQGLSHSDVCSWPQYLGRFGLEAVSRRTHNHEAQ